MTTAVAGGSGQWIARQALLAVADGPTGIGPREQAPCLVHGWTLVLVLVLVAGWTMVVVNGWTMVLVSRNRRRGKAEWMGFRCKGMGRNVCCWSVGGNDTAHVDIRPRQACVGQAQATVPYSNGHIS